MPKKLEVRRGMLEPDELSRFLEAEERSRYRVIWMLMCDCGLRVGEVLRMRLNDVVKGFDRELKLVKLTETIRIVGKRRKVRYASITYRLRVALEAYCREEIESGEDPLSEGMLFRIGERAIQAHFKVIARKAGITRSYLCPHSLRHTYATRLLRAGIDPLTVSVSLGHSSMETTMGYLHTSPELLQRVSSALDESENCEGNSLV